MTWSDLPALNAGLNAFSASCLLTGRWFIHQKKVAAHRACMSGAVVASILFLISYILYHSKAGVTRFMGLGLIRSVYFFILSTHTVLAAGVLPLVILTLVAARREKWDRHRALARWTWPIWLYVSITGVLIFFFLKRWS